MALIGAIGPALVLIFWFSLRRLDDTMLAREEDLVLLRTGSPCSTRCRCRRSSSWPRDCQPAARPGRRASTSGAGRSAAEGCYVIERGQAEVLGDGRRIATVGPGDLVGEIALLRQVPRTATVRALTDLDVKLLDADRFICVVTGWGSSREVTSGHVDELLERFSPEADQEPE